MREERRWRGEKRGEERERRGRGEGGFVNFFTQVVLNKLDIDSTTKYLHSHLFVLIYLILLFVSFYFFLFVIFCFDLDQINKLTYELRREQKRNARHVDSDGEMQHYDEMVYIVEHVNVVNSTSFLVSVFVSICFNSLSLKIKCNYILSEVSSMEIRFENFEIFSNFCNRKFRETELQNFYF